MASVAKRIHFGDFLRWAVDQNDGPTEFAQRRGISLASLTKWTKAPTREATKMSALSALELAKALGFASVEEFDAKWQSTPVEPYPRRANGREPDTSEAAQIERFRKLFPELSEGQRDEYVLAQYLAIRAEVTRLDQQIRSSPEGQPSPATDDDRPLVGVEGLSDKEVREAAERAKAKRRLLQQHAPRPKHVSDEKA